MIDKNRVKLLAELNKDQLLHEFRRTVYSKWGALCFLRYLGFRVLDSAFIDQIATEADTYSIFKKFVKGRKLEKVLIRTDGGAEKGGFMRGGNSIKVSIAFDVIRKIQNTGRSIIISTPTNRFTHELSLNLGLDASGLFKVELLGPGFDLSDINRGLITPEVAIEISNIDWISYNPPNPMFIKFKIQNPPIAEMRKNRLHRIGKELLPAIGIVCEGSPIDFAKKWLKSNGYVQLFKEDRPKIQRGDSFEWYDIAFFIGSCYRQFFDWKTLVINATDLGDGEGLLFWDVINPEKKFKHGGISRESENVYGI